MDDLAGVSGVLGPVAVALLLVIGLILKHFAPIAPAAPAPAGEADSIAALRRRIGVIDAKIEGLSQRIASGKESHDALRGALDALQSQHNADMQDIMRTLGRIEGALQADSGEPPPRRSRG